MQEDHHEFEGSLGCGWNFRLVYRVTFCLKYINTIIRGKTQHVASLCLQRIPTWLLERGPVYPTIRRLPCPPSELSVPCHRAVELLTVDFSLLEP